MSGYTKLFNTILASTIWREAKETKILWITMLAMSDKNGIVEGSIPGLADMARLTVAETQKSLAELHEPDEFSRTKTNEGRRVATVDGGWQILNHAKYRAKMNADERREYLRIKQAESRGRKATPRKSVSTNVNKCQKASTLSTHAEAYSDADTDSKAEALREKKQPPAASGSAFLESLRSNPAYNGIDINMELSKMDAWLLTSKGRGRKKTERFILNWLNHADRELPASPVLEPAKKDYSDWTTSKWKREPTPAPTVSDSSTPSPS